MSDVITTGVGDAERQAERDLGAVVNEVEHLSERLLEHTTTLDGLKQDKEWIAARIEALERDLEAIPKVPGELETTVMQSLSELTTRLERLENSLTEPDEHTEPPQRHRSEDESAEDRRERSEKGRSLLDRLF